MQNIKDKNKEQGITPEAGRVFWGAFFLAWFLPGLSGGQDNGMWSMFFFGFGGLFILKQMHGLRLRPRVRWGFLGLYSAAALVTYSIRDIRMLHQITWIPIIEYAGVFLLAGLIGLGLKVTGRRQAGRSTLGAEG